MAKKDPADKVAGDLYKTYFDRVQVRMFDLSKIFRDIKAALLAGGDLDSAMKGLVAKYKVA